MVSRKHSFFSLILTLFIAGSVSGQGEKKLYHIEQKNLSATLLLDDSYFRHEDDTQKQGVGTLTLDDEVLMEDVPCYAYHYAINDISYFFLTSIEKSHLQSDDDQTQDTISPTHDLKYTSMIRSDYALKSNAVPERFTNISNYPGTIVKAGDDVIQITHLEKEKPGCCDGDMADYRKKQIDRMQTQACGSENSATFISIYTTLQPDYVEIVHEFLCPGKYFFLKDIKRKFFRTCTFD